MFVVVAVVVVDKLSAIIFIIIIIVCVCVYMLSSIFIVKTNVSPSSSFYIFGFMGVGRLNFKLCNHTYGIMLRTQLPSYN